MIVRAARPDPITPYCRSAEKKFLLQKKQMEIQMGSQKLLEKVELVEKQQIIDIF
jgi:hypothetical protein